jgi:2-polyprenyl-3-methyl-5-hydroxy-6-metoxy-1,4-benzoquinol methylase
MTPYPKEYIACNLCGSDDARLLFRPQELPDGRIGGIVRCRQCGLVYRNIRQPGETTRRHYEKEYFPQDLSAGRKTIFSHYLRLIDGFRKYNRILDVGSGHGSFLRLCASNGWECHGVEISQKATEFARHEFGLTIFNGPLGDAHYPDEFFDVVTLWNVLDHLTDPGHALKEIHRILRPGGGLFLRFPNAFFQITCHKSFIFFSNIWAKIGSLDPSVFHLYSFDRHSIERLLIKAGFGNISISNSVLSWSSPSEKKRRYGKEVISRLIYGIARLVSLLTGGKRLIGPSLFVTAFKSVD